MYAYYIGIVLNFINYIKYLFISVYNVFFIVRIGANECILNSE